MSGGGERGLRHEIVRPGELPDPRRDELFALLSAHYDRVSRPAFERDLAEKDHVILLLDEAGAVCGFSTQQIFTLATDAGPARFLFSGDTIIHRDHWGSQALARAWGGYAGSRLAESSGPLYWLLVSKGFRTYLYLPLFFREYHPRHDAPTPPAARALMDLGARHKFGACYRPELGVVEFPDSLGQLKGPLAEIPRRQRADPRVRFFLQRNPGYNRGHELVCLAAIRPENFRSLGRHWIAAGIRSGTATNDAAPDSRHAAGDGSPRAEGMTLR